MANVTRMRCIENRRQTARSANVGLSSFIDQIGRFHYFSKKGTLQVITTKLKAINTITMYTKNPNWFPLFSLGIFFPLLLFQLYYSKFYHLIK